jgi:hypothetical protein
MSKELPKDNRLPDDGKRAYIQYRGAETSVVSDDYGIVFTTNEDGRHKPLPVVEEGEEDAPANGVLRQVAEDLVERNRNVCFGVACEVEEAGEVCGEVLARPEALNGHKSKHDNNEDIE